MKSNFDRYKKDLKSLITEGETLVQMLNVGVWSEIKIKDGIDEKGRKEIQEVKDQYKDIDFKLSYNLWYTESLELIRQVIPSRFDDFVNLYKQEKRKKIDHQSYCIQDYLNNLTLGGKDRMLYSLNAIQAKLEQQFNILKSAEARFESSLFDVQQLLQADIFDSELDAAKELNKKGFMRGAGAIAGVVLESHLLKVTNDHRETMKKKNPSLGEINQHLKDKDIYDFVAWRNIDHLISIRNLCDHKKDREPTKDEIFELISGVDKTIKTIF